MCKLTADFNSENVNCELVVVDKMAAKIPRRSSRRGISKTSFF
jgi:hypothetical protein